MSQERINVTKTFLPPIEEYEAYIQDIWSRAWITNQGPLVDELEEGLKKYLRLTDLHYVTNGTTGLEIALQALGITSGEIITTPFSYVATTSSILWKNCKPVFVDIEPESFCIDPNKIDNAITAKTKAIMPVHVFGNPCNVEAIEAIAKKHSLKVIYDAAHAFGVNYKGKSLFDHGDISVGSFHATKLFHTIEGGCVIPRKQAVSDKVELLKRFGHNGDEHVMLGMNAKASEFHAAMGLCNLKYIDSIIQKRRAICELYDQLLGDRLQRPVRRPDTEYNYSYYPVLFKNEVMLHKTLKRLNEQNIFPRRYFYPSLNTLSYIKEKYACPISEDISSRIVCLPLYSDLDKSVVTRICEIINA